MWCSVTSHPSIYFRRYDVSRLMSSMDFNQFFQNLLFSLSLFSSNGHFCHSLAPPIFLSVSNRIRPVFNLTFRTRVRAFEGIRLVTGFKKIDHVLVRMRDRNSFRHPKSKVTNKRGPPLAVTSGASEIIKSVLLKLKKSLDDPKRVIRKEAALAWNVWSMVGQP